MYDIIIKVIKIYTFKLLTTGAKPIDTVIKVNKNIDSLIKLLPPPVCSPPVIANFNINNTKSNVTNTSTIYFE